MSRPTNLPDHTRRHLEDVTTDLNGLDKDYDPPSQA
jgi:hypothetical protein